jgi:hypothetical protein
MISKYAIGPVLVLFFCLTASAGQPSITLNPATGPDTGGTTITITGSNTNFAQGTTAVTFGATAATNVTVASATSLTCVTPAGTGTVNVTATTGAEVVTRNSAYVYTNSGGGGGSGFRFLNTALPDGSTNLVYDATLLTANAAGAVTYSVQAGTLPPGMILVSSTGLLTGIPTVVTTNAVTFAATDGTTTITLAATIKITAKGGGGNSGVSFPIDLAFPDGRVGLDYAKEIAIQAGVGPFLFGVDMLPPGLGLTGIEDRDATVTLTGRPTAAGTFFMTLSATDLGEGNNKVITIVPITILPADSDFRFTTLILDNGQLGTAYDQTITTSGTAASVLYGATGVPAGLSIDPLTGVLSGTPLVAGTFLVNITAFDGTNTISLNRQILIAPSASSTFHWVFSGGLPLAILNVPYNRTNPPLVLVTENPGPGQGVVYSASGLPAGISYDAGTGTFNGTPIEPGIYPVTFTATASGSGEVLTLSYDFIVLPPNGGDVNNLPINLWVKKLQIKKTGTALKDSLSAQYLYNADRRTGRRFDPTKDTLAFEIASLPRFAITPPTTNLSGKFPKLSFKSADKAAQPSVQIKFDESAQSISLAMKAITINDTFPGTIKNAITRGTKGFKLDLFIDAKGKFTAALGYRKTAFIVDKAKAKSGAAGKDSLSFGFLLGDPAFAFPNPLTQSKSAIFRLYNVNGEAVLERDFTDLVTAATSVDSQTGTTVYKLKSGKDANAVPVKFSYDSKSGKGAIAFSRATLSKLTNAEEHLSVELTLAGKQYFTGITLFAPKAGGYSTKIP